MSAVALSVDEPKKLRTGSAQPAADGWNALKPGLVALVLAWLGVLPGRVARRVSRTWNTAGHHLLSIPKRVVLLSEDTTALDTPDLHYYAQEMNPVVLTLLFSAERWTNATMHSALDALIGTVARSVETDRLTHLMLGCFFSGTASVAVNFEHIAQLLRSRRNLRSLSLTALTLRCGSEDLAVCDERGNQCIVWPPHQLEQLLLPECRFERLTETRGDSAAAAAPTQRLSGGSTLAPLRCLGADPGLLRVLLPGQKTLTRLACLSIWWRNHRWYATPADTASVTRLELLLSDVDMFDDDATAAAASTLFPKLARFDMELDLDGDRAVPGDALRDWQRLCCRFWNQAPRPLQTLCLSMNGRHWAQVAKWEYPQSLTHLELALPPPSDQVLALMTRPLAVIEPAGRFAWPQLPAGGDCKQLISLVLTGWCIGEADWSTWLELPSLATVRLVDCACVAGTKSSDAPDSGVVYSVIPSLQALPLPARLRVSEQTPAVTARLSSCLVTVEPRVAAATVEA